VTQIVIKTSASPWENGEIRLRREGDDRFELTVKRYKGEKLTITARDLRALVAAAGAVLP
jgi:hypothetical protein